MCLAFILDIIKISHGICNAIADLNQHHGTENGAMFKNYYSRDLTDSAEDRWLQLAYTANYTRLKYPKWASDGRWEYMVFNSFHAFKNTCWNLWTPAKGDFHIYWKKQCTKIESVSQISCLAQTNFAALGKGFQLICGAPSCVNLTNSLNKLI